ncbi:hypothetical protein, partial [Sinomonas soli]
AMPAPRKTSVPATAKQPQDHRPKLSDELAVTWEGHEYTIDREALEDIEFIGYLQDNRFREAMPELLGAEQWDALRENHRSAKGRLTLTRIGEFLEEVHKQAGLGNS